MANYYDILKTLTDEFTGLGMVNSVTNGSIDKYTTLKKHMYPAVHIIVNNWNVDGHTKTYNISVICMSIVEADYSNEDDVINQCMVITDRFFEQGRRGDLSELDYTIESETMQGELFVDRFEDNVAGVTVTFDIVTPNLTTIC